VFGCVYAFLDLYADGGRYFVPSDRKVIKGTRQRKELRTHFIPDAVGLVVDDAEYKVSGGQVTGYLMGPVFPHGHISAWPAGRYHKAHYHGPGAILLGLSGQGYVLAWDAALGPRPYANGHGDEVLKVDWRRHSIYSPPNGYYHQHFNSGAAPARHAAVYGAKLPLGSHAVYAEAKPGDWGGALSTREGGTLIEYEDEDPQIRKDFEAAIRPQGVVCTMPVVEYR
jgi:hypothetical protein